MRKSEAKQIALTITNEQLLIMLNNAKEQISDWTVASIVNKGLSKGIAWNILGSKFDVEIIYNVITKTNMIREFGEYLPDELKPEKKKAKPIQKVIHQEPKF